MEIEYFVEDDADKAMEIYEKWKENSMKYWINII
jgi:prefoldin subunit 5